MKNVSTLASILAISAISIGAYAEKSVKASVRYHENHRVTSVTPMDAGKSGIVTDANGCQWNLQVGSRTVAGNKTAHDYTFTWELKKGYAENVSFSVDFEMDKWTSENYVFVPAIVYDGNRFATKDIGYPPFWYDKTEWRTDMPTTITSYQPRLARNGEPGRAIELTSGNASTPLMAYFSEKDHEAWMVQTHQGNELGDYGLSITENEDCSKAVFSIIAPVTRTGNRSDFPATVREGEKVTVSCRIYEFKAKRRADMMERFADIRKDLNKSERREVLPYSQLWKLMDNLYQTRRWDDRIDMYWLGDVKEKASWNFVWQLGWCGGGQATYPILLRGTDTGKERAVKNLDAIYDRTQAKSGLFYAYGNGKEFCGFGYGKPLDHNVTFTRSQGDWLYLSQLQMNLLKKRGKEVKDTWMEGTRKHADAFVRLWEKYGQFGQFLDVETGDICIGNSCAGAIVPAGLALAASTYGRPHYLEVAKKAGRWFYDKYVRNGYTTGGPGEILSTPDSESAFALFESFMALYEATRSKEWLEYASELLPICASWTVSYDFRFPDNSDMAKAGARSTGAVWASVANKHGAPGICTWSGNSLLKYYRATADKRALELLEDIAHGLPQYVCRKECPIASMPWGGICERVNLSDWEGKGAVGGNIFASCSWCEVAAMLTATQMPSIYVQTDTGQMAVFDHLKVKKGKRINGKMSLEITNPTPYPAEVRIYAETSKEARRNPMAASSNGLQSILMRPGETKDVLVD